MHIPHQRIPQRLGMLGVQVDFILSALQPEADSTFTVGRAAEAISQGSAGRHDGASDSDPLTLAAYVTQCPKIFVR
jgi:hypothetical protein